MKYRKLDKLLLQSIQNDDFEQVKALIDQGANINLKDPAGTPILHLTHNSDILKFLIQSGADVNATNADGYSLIYGHKTPRAIKLLVKYGAKVNVKSKDGFSPLCLEVANNHLDTAKALLDAGADVNYKICHGGTALFFCKTIKMLKLLIEYGADINVKNDYGYMVIETTPHKEIAKYINNLYMQNAKKCLKKQVYNFPVMTTGFQNLDCIIKDKKSKLVIVTGPEALYRHDFARTIAFNAAKSIYNKQTGQQLGAILLFCLASSIDSCICEILADHTKTTLSAMRERLLTDKEIRSLKHSFGNILHMPLFIDDTMCLSIPKIINRALQIAQKQNGLALMVIDDLELVFNPQIGNKERILETIQKLTKMVDAFHVPVIVFARSSILQTLLDVHKQNNKIVLVKISNLK